MKKLFLSAMLAFSGLTMSAADYVVYQNGQLGNFQVYGWWNASMDFKAANPSGEGEVFTFKASDGGAAASMGINAMAEAVNPGKLHDATLDFDWYTTTAGQEIHIRLTSIAEQDYVFTTTDEQVGKWNHLSLSVKEKFPNVSADWLVDANNGQGYVFAVTLDKAVAATELSFNNIIYTNVDESWVAPEKEELPAPTNVPVPAHDASKVISLFSSAYSDATTFGIGSWGQSTKATQMDIEGKKVMKITAFSYLGWELGQHIDLSDCNMMHVDFFASNEGNFGFTPIGGGENSWKTESVKVGEWNSYDVPLTKFPNVNLSDVYQVKFDQGNGKQEGYIANVYFYKDENLKGPEFGAVWYGSAENVLSFEGKDYTVTFDYNITANEDGTITVEAMIDGAEDITGITYQMHIAGEWPTFTQTDGVFTLTSPNKFTLGQEVKDFFFWLPYAGGSQRTDISYVFGESNQKPAAVPTLRLSASVSDITSSSAIVNYELKASSEFDDVDVKILLNDVIILENPYIISGLEQNKAYSFTIKAVAELDGQTYESKPVELNFRTLRDGAEPAIWHGITDGLIKNAYLPGEDPATARRELPVSIQATLTYNPDQTMTVEATFNGQLPVGFVPSVTLRGKYDRKPMTLVEGSTYTATTPSDVTYEYGEAFDYLYFFIAYDGGDTGNGNAIQGYHAGDENDGAAYGEPASIEINTVKSALSVGESTYITAIVKDNNGHYLLSEAPVLKVDDPNFSIEGTLLTANGMGIANVSAECGSLSASVEVKCINTIDASNLYNENCQLSSDTEGLNLALAFDNNEGTQVEWNCSETEEHYLMVDFGKVRSVQSIELVWEGASATEYTVTLSADAAQEGEINALAAGDYVTKVFEVTDGEGGAGVTARNTLYNSDLSANDARYVRLDTKKAFEAGWGIKLKEMRIMGNDNISTGVENIATDCNSAVEYFNLQGVRVVNPSNGIFIRRQGNKTVKVIL